MAINMGPEEYEGKQERYQDLNRRLKELEPGPIVYQPAPTLTRRDLFIAAALQGLLASCKTDDARVFAADAIRVADAVMEADK